MYKRQDPDNPNMDALPSFESAEDMTEKLGELSYRCPKTKERVSRMLQNLYTTGFAAFG